MTVNMRSIVVCPLYDRQIKHLPCSSQAPRPRQRAAFDASLLDGSPRAFEAGLLAAYGVRHSALRGNRPDLAGLEELAPEPAEDTAGVQVGLRKDSEISEKLLWRLLLACELYHDKVSSLSLNYRAFDTQAARYSDICFASSCGHCVSALDQSTLCECAATMSIRQCVVDRHVGAGASTFHSAC